MQCLWESEKDDDDDGESEAMYEPVRQEGFQNF